MLLRKPQLHPHFLTALSRLVATENPHYEQEKLTVSQLLTELAVDQSDRFLRSKELNISVHLHCRWRLDEDTETGTQQLDATQHETRTADAMSR